MNNLRKNDKGAALATVVLTFAIVTPLFLMLTSLVLNDLQNARRFENSTVARVAVETGLDQALYLARKKQIFDQCVDAASCDIPLQRVLFSENARTTDAVYETVMVNCKTYTVPSGQSPPDWCCQGGIDNRCIRSLGSYRGANRALELIYTDRDLTPLSESESTP